MKGMGSVYSMRTHSLSSRENYLRSVEFRSPEYIPCRVMVTWPLWLAYGEKLERIYQAHKFVIQPKDVHPSWKDVIKSNEKLSDAQRFIPRASRMLTDPFGCVWSFNIEGYQGQVVRHPLERWENFKNYVFPDPEKGLPSEGSDKLTPWSEIATNIERMRFEGKLVQISLTHGLFFQRLYYLRGFTNLMKDFMQRPPQIYELVDKLTEYILELVDRLLECGRIDVVYIGDDLGTQTRMPISPSTFREFIYPSYRKIFGRIRDRGVHVYFHSDGHVVEVLDQIIEAGASVLNVQDRVNGLENIRALCRGKVCVDIDVDRQYLVPFGKPEEIKSHIKRIVECLSLKRGGLMIEAEVHPPTPLANIEALAESMEENMWL
ncbi:MAG: uroporphyrinogen decarboxylase family protein [Candidatus Bathyarchaeia archaeon]